MTAPAWSQEWTGKINGVDAYIPDMSKPIRAAMIMGYGYHDKDWRAVAAEYNCLMIATTLNYYDSGFNAQKVVAFLRQASKDFPAHPEIQHTCVTLYGWSQQSMGACVAAMQPELTNRVLAVVGIHLISGPGANVYGGSFNPALAVPHFNFRPPLSVPHLFISAGVDDFASNLSSNNSAVIDQAAAGAPITMVNDILHEHSDVENNQSFTRIWLEEVFKRRLPAVPPTTADVVLPSWQKDSIGWRGVYDFGYKKSTLADGSAVQEQDLCNVAIFPYAAKYADTRQSIWFPSQWCAQVWEVYSNKRIMPAYGTLMPPELVAPSIFAQPQNVTVPAGQRYGFTARQLELRRPSITGFE